MSKEESRSVMREIGAILLLSMFLALIYNFFTPKGLPLIRAITQKIAVSDSALFSQVARPDTLQRDTVGLRQTHDATPPPKGPAVKPDSMSAGKSKNTEDIQIISLGQVKRILDRGNALFIDARSSEEFVRAHIRGSINIFGDEPERHFEQLTTVSPDTMVVVYCNGPDCHLGRNLIKFMKMMEFKRLYLYDEGWDGWQQAKMPVESGDR